MNGGGAPFKALDPALSEAPARWPPQDGQGLLAPIPHCTWWAGYTVWPTGQCGLGGGSFCHCSPGVSHRHLWLQKPTHSHLVAQGWFWPMDCGQEGARAHPGWLGLRTLPLPLSRNQRHPRLVAAHQPGLASDLELGPSATCCGIQ